MGLPAVSLDFVMPESAHRVEDIPLVYPREILEKLGDLEVAMRRAEARDAAFRRWRDRALDVVFWGTMAIFGGIVVSQFVDRDPPAHYEVRLLDTQIHAGDKLRMLVRPQRYRMCEFRVTFSAFDGEGSPKIASTDWAFMQGQPGIDVPFIRSLTIPPDAAPGPSRLRIQREFRCPMNLVQQEWPIVQVDPDIPYTTLPPVKK